MSGPSNGKIAWTGGSREQTEDIDCLGDIARGLGLNDAIWG